MTLYLVRHALALAKSSWSGLDSDRPLDAKGRRQVVGLTDWFATRAVDAVVTSPAVRCVATVLPVANHHDVDLVTTRALLVGADKEARKLVRRLGSRRLGASRPSSCAPTARSCPASSTRSVTTATSPCSTPRARSGRSRSVTAGRSSSYELPDPGEDPILT